MNDTEQLESEMLPSFVSNTEGAPLLMHRWGQVPWEKGQLPNLWPQVEGAI